MLLAAEVAARFKPAAQTFFYRFGAREVASVVQGLCAADPLYCTTPLSLCRLWYHEARRVYGDPLVTALEAERCLDLTQGAARRVLGQWAPPNDLFVEPCLFTSFAATTLEEDDGAEETYRGGAAQKGAPGAYLAVADWPTLRLLLHEKLRNYNEAGHAAMDLVLFDGALEHVCRLARVLSRPRGHALVVGARGAGKASLAKLAAFCVGLDLHAWGEGGTASAAAAVGAPGDDDALEGLRAELRALQRRAGADPGEPVAFLVSSDAQDERGLSMVNDLLASGVVHGLFSPAEEDELVDLVRPAARLDGILDSRRHLLAYFTAKVRANLHVVLCASPPALRRQARRFPALIACSSLNYVAAWPHNSLVAVGRHFLHHMPGLRPPEPNAAPHKSHAAHQTAGGEGGDGADSAAPEPANRAGAPLAFDARDLAPPSPGRAASSGPGSPLADNLAYHFAHVHASAEAAAARAWAEERRAVAVTPKCFLEAIHLFRHLLVLRASALETDVARFEAGLAVMRRAEDDVTVLKVIYKAGPPFWPLRRDQLEPRACVLSVGCCVLLGGAAAQDGGGGASQGVGGSGAAEHGRGAGRGRRAGRPRRGRAA